MKKIIVFLIVGILLSFLPFLSLENAVSEDVVYNISNIKHLIKDRGIIPYCYPTSFSPDGRKIAFIQKALNEKKIYLVGSDGRNITLLYKSNYSLSDATFSPDGRKIAFIESVVNSTTNESYLQISLLTKNGSWEKDGLKKESIYRLNPEDYFRNSITFVVWSSDGKIIFGIDSRDSEKKGTWSINPDGTGLTKISSFTYDTVSPDCKKALKIMSDEGVPELWIMNIDGSEKKRLLDSTWLPYMAAFAPDGEIVFSAGRSSLHSMATSPPNIWIMEQDGSNKRMIVPGDPFNSGMGYLDPVMSPDMKKLVFTSLFGLLYYIDDPTGEWKDSDGDGVYDGIDRYPNDPYMGYIGENPTMSWIMKNIALILVITIVSVAVIAYAIKKRNETKKRKAVNEPSEDVNPQNGKESKEE